jgi:hypothetical protein
MKNLERYEDDYLGVTIGLIEKKLSDNSLVYDVTIISENGQAKIECDSLEHATSLFTNLVESFQKVNV